MVAIDKSNSGVIDPDRKNGQTALRVAKVNIDWHPDLSIYASESFLKAAGDEYGWIGGFDRCGGLRCVLPYTVVRKAIFRMVRFRVETISLGEALSAEEERAFLDNAVEYLRSTGADMIIPATTNTVFRTYPGGALAAPYGSYVIDLSETEEKLFNNVSASHRRKVRLAEKGGVQIRSGPDYQHIAYALVRDTFKRSGLGFMNENSFERYVRSLGENVQLLVAEHQGVVQGCAVVPFSKNSAYYVYGGSIPEPFSGAMHLLHWDAIRRFRNLGTKRYDFVGARINPPKGSKQEGIATFKERFGAHLVQGYMWKYSIRPLKYRLYCLAVRWLRGGDIVDQESSKMKYESAVQVAVSATGAPAGSNR